MQLKRKKRNNMAFKSSSLNERLKIRFAEKEDLEILLDFIKKLAVYEKRPDTVIATTDDLKKALFEKKIAEAVISEYAGQPSGFAIFYYNFSTFIGKPGIYIEDLYVNEELRNKGIGKAMFVFLAELALKRDCAMLEWTVLKWNTPAIKFYEKMGATNKEEWFIYRLDKKALADMASLTF